MSAIPRTLTEGARLKIGGLTYIVRQVKEKVVWMELLPARGIMPYDLETVIRELENEK